MRNAIAVAALSLLAGCAHPSQSRQPENPSRRRVPQAERINVVWSHAWSQEPPQNHRERYAAYQRHRQAIEAEVPSLLQGINPAGFDRVIHHLIDIDETLIAPTGMYHRSREGEDRIEACLADYEVVRYVNTTARRLLWAGKQFGYGFSVAQGDAELPLYLLGHFVGRTNFGTSCGSHNLCLQGTEITQGRDNGRYDSAIDEALWARYTTFTERVESDDPVAAALNPATIAELEELAAIAENPALSCAHADRVRAHTNFAAGNVLAMIHMLPMREIPPIDNRGFTYRLADVIARTEAAYVCPQQ